jgi:hypothetical protein
MANLQRPGNDVVVGFKKGIAAPRPGVFSQGLRIGEGAKAPKLPPPPRPVPTTVGPISVIKPKN